MHTYIFICIHPCIYVYIFIYIYTYSCIYVYTYTYIYMYMYMYIYTCIRIHILEHFVLSHCLMLLLTTHTWMYTYLYECIHTCINVNVCTYVYVYIYIYAYNQIYLWCIFPRVLKNTYIYLNTVSCNIGCCSSLKRHTGVYVYVYVFEFVCFYTASYKRTNKYIHICIHETPCSAALPAAPP